MTQRAIFIDDKRIQTTPLEFALIVVFYRQGCALTRVDIENGRLVQPLRSVFGEIGLFSKRYTKLVGWDNKKTAMTRFMQTVSRLNRKLPTDYQIRNTRHEYGEARYALSRVAKTDSE